MKCSNDSRNVCAKRGFEEESVETGFELKEGGDHFFVVGGVVD